MKNLGKAHRYQDPCPGDLTLLLRRWHQGDPEAAGKVFPIVYNELRRLSGRLFRSERPDHTLTPTALVHEAYIKLIGGRPECRDHVHFFALAATVMRQILVDHARTRVRGKRGGDQVKVPLDDTVVPPDEASLQVVRLDEALTLLQSNEPLVARVVELHYFGGLNYDEIAEVLGASRSTVNRELRFAKAWLKKELAHAGSARSAAP